MARDGLHDVLIVDRMLPKLDGLSVIRNLRAEGVTTPVLILSALCPTLMNACAGFRAGGDDYLAKPYAFSELLARVEGMSRRNVGSVQETRLKACDLELDLLTREVTRGRQGHSPAAARVQAA